MAEDGGRAGALRGEVPGDVHWQWQWLIVGVADEAQRKEGHAGFGTSGGECGGLHVHGGGFGGLVQAGLFLWSMDGGCCAVQKPVPHGGRQMGQQGRSGEILGGQEIARTQCRVETTRKTAGQYPGWFFLNQGRPQSASGGFLSDASVQHVRAGRWAEGAAFRWDGKGHKAGRGGHGWQKSTGNVRNGKNEVGLGKTTRLWCANLSDPAMNAFRTIALLATTGTFALAQAPAPTLDVQDMQKAEQLSVEGKYQEALKLYQGIEKNYPSSPFIPGSRLGMAICYFFLKDYDKAVEAVTKNLTAKNVPPEVLERSALLIPQIQVQKADQAPADQPTVREKSFKDAIKGFDEFVKKFPKSPEVETALLGKGRAMAFIEDYEGATKALREGLEKFPTSPTVQDTKFTYGLVNSFQAIKAIRNLGDKADATAKAALEEAEKTFREIINARQDLVLMNSSYMQIGEVLALKAAQLAKDAEEQKKLNEQALEFYRNVRTKEEVVAAQEARIAFYDGQRKAAVQAGKLDDFRQWGRVVEKEREKLEGVKAQPDQSLQAKLKAGQIFLALGKFDEARVMLKFVDGFLADTDKEEKRRVLAFLCVTYAAQHVPDKAVELYEKFKTAYPKDPDGENLALLVGAVFLDADPKINDPQKAIKYFDEQIANYPTSKFSGQAVLQKTQAQMQSKNFPEALKALEDFIKSSKDPELLSLAEFNLANLHREMGAIDKAVTAYKAVREKYPQTEYAEQAAFWGPQLSIGLDAKAAVKDLESFLAKYPQSDLVPSARYFLAVARRTAGDRPGAVRAFQELIDKHPEAEPTTNAFFDIAAIQQKDAEDAATKGKPDYTKVRETMQQFIQKYPQHDRAYAAFDFSAQLLVKEEKLEEAMQTYRDYIEKYAGNVNVARAHLAIANILKNRAEKMGAYLSLAKADQEKWVADMNAAVQNAEQGIEKFPTSDAVSQLLDVALKIDTLRMNIGLRKAEDVEGYFTGLAAKFDSEKGTKAKILFALASFLREREKGKMGKWFEIMKAAYDPALVFSPSDLDIFGNALADNKLLDQARAVFEKVGKDYPVPPGADPAKVTRSVGEAQSVMLAGLARVLQAEGKAAEGQKLLEQLKTLYPWSGKVAEADYGIGVGLFEQKQYEEAAAIFGDVAKKNTAPVPLRAKAMMHLAKSLEATKYYDSAINNYVKIGHFFESEAELAAEGIFQGAQLLEQQAAGKLPLKDPIKPKAEPAKAAASPRPGASPQPAATAKPAGAAKATPAKK